MCILEHAVRTTLETLWGLIIVGSHSNQNERNMRLYLIIFIFFLSCSSKSTYENDSQIEITELENLGELKLILDGEVSSMLLNFIVYDEYVDEILIIPSGVNKIKRFSAETGELLGDIFLESEGPNGVGSVGVYNFVVQPISKDKLLLAAKWHETLYFLNRKGEVIEKFRLEDLNIESSFLNHFSKIIYQDSLLILPTLDALKEGELDFIYYEIDLNSRKKKEIVLISNHFNEFSVRLNDPFERSNTLGGNGALITLFPFRDSLLVWRDGRSKIIPIQTGALKANIYPKNIDAYWQKLGEYGELSYKETFSKLKNISYVPYNDQYILNYDIGEPISSEKKYPSGIIILDKDFKILAHVVREMGFSQYFLVRKDQILVASATKTKSEAELVFDVLALPK